MINHSKPGGDYEVKGHIHETFQSVDTVSHQIDFIVSALFRIHLKPLVSSTGKGGTSNSKGIACYQKVKYKNKMTQLTKRLLG